MAYNESPAKQVQGIIDPLTGLPVAPAIASNTLGAAKPVFDAGTQKAAAGIYGQEQVPGTFGRAIDPLTGAPLMKKCKYKK
jgi:hypothetical protein